MYIYLDPTGDFYQKYNNLLEHNFIENMKNIQKVYIIDFYILIGTYQ